MDSIVEAIIYKFRSRSELGIKKYGTTLDRNDLTQEEWLDHAIEEAMDLILYLQKLKTHETKRLPNNNQGESTTNTSSL